MSPSTKSPRNSWGWKHQWADDTMWLGQKTSSLQVNDLILLKCGHTKTLLEEVKDLVWTWVRLDLWGMEDRYVYFSRGTSQPGRLW